MAAGGGSNVREATTATPHPKQVAEELSKAIKAWKPKPKPKAPPKPKTTDFPATGDDLKVIKTLGGSTGAKLVEDKNGKQYVMKTGKNAGHLREEAAADDLYRAMGLDVPRSKIYDRPGGPVKLSEFHAGKTLGELERSDPVAYQNAVSHLRKGFVAHALMGNWDVSARRPITSS